MGVGLDKLILGGLKEKGGSKIIQGGGGGGGVESLGSLTSLSWIY